MYTQAISLFACVFAHVPHGPSPNLTSFESINPGTRSCLKSVSQFRTSELCSFKRLFKFRAIEPRNTLWMIITLRCLTSVAFLVRSLAKKSLHKRARAQLNFLPAAFSAKAFSTW